MSIFRSFLYTGCLLLQCWIPHATVNNLYIKYCWRWTYGCPKHVEATYENKSQLLHQVGTSRRFPNLVWFGKNVQIFGRNLWSPPSIPNLSFLRNIVIYLSILRCSVTLGNDVESEANPKHRDSLTRYTWQILCRGIINRLHKYIFWRRSGKWL